MKKNLLVLLFLIITCPSLFAQGDFTWTGGAGTNNWGTSGNWTLTSGTDADGIPDSDDNVYINSNNDFTGLTVLVNGSFGANNLTLDATGSFSTIQLAVPSSSILDVNGVFAFQNSATLNNQGTLLLAGSLSGNINIIQGNSSTFTYDGNSNQTLRTNLTYNNLTINKSGGTLTLNGNIAINNNFTHTSGTFNHSAGTITFAGSGGVISGSVLTSFLHIAFDGNTSNNGDVEIKSTGTVSLGSSVTFDADGTGSGSFRLRSTSSTNTAKILTIPTGSSITGNVIVERYMQDITPLTGTEDWRYISSPIQNATVADLMAAKNQNYIITGSFSGASTCPTTQCDPSLLSYTEQEAGNLSNGWYTNLISSTSDILEVGRGYITYQRDENSPVTLELTGPVNQGNVSLPVYYTDGGTGNIYDNGWNIVGNPYPAPIDWTLSKSTGGALTGAWDVTSLNGAIYLRDNEGFYVQSNNYVTHNGSVGTPASFNGIVAVGQSFWVKSDGGNPALIVTESAKTSTSGAFVRKAAPENVFRIQMIRGSNPSIWDETVLHFRDDASVAYESDIDALKRLNYNSSVNFSSISPEGHPLVINSLPTDEYCINIPLLINSTNAIGTYKFNFLGLETFAYDVDASLKDNLTNEIIPIDASTVYQFEITSDAASKGAGRFVIIISKTPSEINLASTSINICSGESATILINDPEIDITYMALINDEIVAQSSSSTGEAIEMNIASTYLNTSSAINFIASSDCSGDVNLSSTFDVIVDDKPTPEIQRIDEYTLRSNYTNGNQWYFNDIKIEGAINQELNILESGKYSLEVTNEFNCSGLVDETLVVTGIDEELEKFGVKIYPNPVEDILTIDTKNLHNPHIFITAINGKIRHTQHLKKGINQIDLSSLDRGIYLLKIKDRNKDIVVRIIKK